MSSPQDPAVVAFLDEVHTAMPSLTIGTVQVRSFGGSVAMADILIGLIASGEKTGTFAMESEFDDAPQRRPVAGALVVVTRFEGAPVLLYRLTEVTVVPYQEIGPQHVAVEGANARDVQVWRSIHWPYWGAMLRACGREPWLDMPVIFQRFELLFTRRL